MNKRHYIFIVIWCFFCSGGWGQSNLNAVLLSTWDDELLKGKISLMAFRQSHPQTLPWLNRIDLRTQTNEFVLKQQEYGLRFYATKPSEIAYRKKIEHLELLQLNDEVNETVHKSLLARYQLLLNLYLNQLERNSILAQASFYKRKINYFESLIQHQLDQEIKDLILSIRKEDKLNAKLYLLNQEDIISFQKLRNLGFKDSLNLSIRAWVTPGDIGQITMLEENPSRSHPYIQRLSLTRDKLHAEQSQLKSEKWNLLDFVQARWRNGPKDDLFNEKVSISAGLRIPYSGTAKKNQNEIAFEELNTNLIQKEWERNHSLKTQTMKEEITVMITQIIQTQQRLTSFEKKYTNPELIQNPLLTTKDQLTIEESILDWSEELIDLQIRLYRLYLDYLDHTRLISEAPYKNYFIAGLPEIK